MKSSTIVDTTHDTVCGWRRADEGSQEKDMLDHYDKAMGVLVIALQ